MNKEELRMSERELKGTLKLLENLKITVENKEEELKELKTQQKYLSSKLKTFGPNSTGVRDRDGEPICIGDTITFLTKGLFSSKTGVVYKVSDNKLRVTAKDSNGKSISRAPHNTRVIKKYREYE